MITPEYCGYLTDVTYDLYHDWTYVVHKLMMEELKRRVGRDDLYLWTTPCTWSFFNRVSEQHAINHLDVSYKLLMEQKNPGGLFCYNWFSHSGKGESLDWLFADNNPDRWEKLEKRMFEIAAEIGKTPLRPGVLD